MDITRRKFLATASTAAGAMIVLSGGTSASAESGLLRLGKLEWADFQKYLNTDFHFGESGSTVALKLIGMEDTRPKRRRTADKECFVLDFAGPSNTQLEQGTYAVNHSALGMFALFIAPGPVTAGGHQSYFAVINRLTS